MIDIYVLNKDFETVGVIDTYESFIWTDRFRDYGDFELYSVVDSNILNWCQQDYYLQISASQHLMIIEGIEITTDVETGNHIKITGRSLESILDRRIIWDQTTVSGGKDHTLKTAVEVLFKLCFGVNGAATGEVPLEVWTKKKGKTIQQTQKITVRTDRVLPSIIYLRPADEVMSYYDEDEEDTVNLTIDKTQYTGDNLYDIFQDLLDGYSNYGIGYRILPLFQMQKIYTNDYLVDRTGLTAEQLAALDPYTFVFELYSGVDRSYNQSDYVYVTFSPDFDNIINTDYLDSLESYKNVTLVLGEGEGTKRTRIIVGGKETDTTGKEVDIPGLYRRELYTDARDLQSSDYKGKANYQKALKQRGLEKLYESTRIVSYDGQVEAERQYEFGVDFLMGDIIQIKNEYGINGTARVIEWIRSESTSGIEEYPTFDAVQLVNDSVEIEEEAEE